jgi:hypothetical protein
MSIQVTPIPRLTVLTVPAFTLGTANAAGSADTAVASNSTLLAFDATDPAAVAASAVVGTATVASRRDHVHAGVIEGVKFYARWNMSGSLADSFNVSSITDSGTGNWSINIANGFSAADAYSVVCMSKTGDTTSAGVITIASNDVFTATVAIIYAVDVNGALRDTTGSGTTGIMAAGYGEQ